MFNKLSCSSYSLYIYTVVVWVGNSSVTSLGQVICEICGVTVVYVQVLYKVNEWKNLVWLTFSCAASSSMATRQETNLPEF